MQFQGLETTRQMWLEECFLMNQHEFLKEILHRYLSATILGLIGWYLTFMAIGQTFLIGHRPLKSIREGNEQNKQEFEREMSMSINSIRVSTSYVSEENSALDCLDIQECTDCTLFI